METINGNKIGTGALKLWSGAEVNVVVNQKAHCPETAFQGAMCQQHVQNNTMVGITSYQSYVAADTEWVDMNIWFNNYTWMIVYHGIDYALTTHSVTPVIHTDGVFEKNSTFFLDSQFDFRFWTCQKCPFYKSRFQNPKKP